MKWTDGAEQGGRDSKALHDGWQGQNQSDGKINADCPPTTNSGDGDGETLGD